MRKFFKQLYVTNRLFIALAVISLMFAVAFIFPPLFAVAQASLILLTAILIVDAVLLFVRSTSVSAQRSVQKIFSLGDENVVSIEIENRSILRLKIEMVDELPEQFQRRGFSMIFFLNGGERKKITYMLRPITRGVYQFGDINILFSDFLGFLRRRTIVASETAISVYPSILQMKQYELKALSRISTQEGIKRLRRIGHSYEFEEIKGYVRGDDHRSINWKASGRKQSLMVNQYEDERAQQIYCVIDRSRAMRMPFNGLSLLDYAVNSSLVISNIALLKTDKAGLLTFADKIQTFLKAERHRSQLHNILEALYAQREETSEANFEVLYQSARYYMKGRSLLLLFTNFESQYALERVMPILRRINQLHLLVVIFFQNTEIEDFSKRDVGSLHDIYDQTIATKFLVEKNQLLTELNRYGIQSIYTKPEDLSINTVNKYLEFKSRGMI